ncbi:MAG: UDP-glucose/GDP-mannose dehydrogenase family protein [Nitrososphaerota archaeon]|nr:UDP-glucose/GDP-mannose dehydrogenase family protein [Nitrososphaerota archaeon]
MAKRSASKGAPKKKLHAARTNQFRISVAGMGYVGLATALCFAQAGNRVYGIEIDLEKCKTIQGGRSPIHEQGIDSALVECLRKESFSCSPDLGEAVRNTDITFITVGTPSRQDGSIDLRYIESAASEIGRIIREKNDYHLVVVKSTVVPGTTFGLVKRALEMSSGKRYPENFGLCVNPEFLREGTAIEDTRNADALIIGAEDKRSSEKLLDLYKSFYPTLPYTLITQGANAEFVKYSVNTFRATQLSFLNSLANLCEQIPSADIVEVTKGLSAVTKIDQRYLRAGLGYGGSCLPKDVRALTATFYNHGISPLLLQSAAETNQRQPLRVIQIIERLLGRSVREKKVAILGLAFKAGTDDVRESVAISLANALVLAGASVSVYDPRASTNAARILLDRVTYSDSALACITGADCCVIATEWEEFGKIPASEFKKRMKTPLVIDGRRIIDLESFEAEGVLVYEIGRHSEHAPRYLEPLPVSTK